MRHHITPYRTEYYDIFIKALPAQNAFQRCPTRPTKGHQPTLTNARATPSEFSSARFTYLRWWTGRTPLEWLTPRMAEGLTTTSRRRRGACGGGRHTLIEQSAREDFPCYVWPNASVYIDDVRVYAACCWVFGVVMIVYVVCFFFRSLFLKHLFSGSFLCECGVCVCWL